MRHIFGSQGANCNNYPKVCVWDAHTDILKKYEENMSKNVITNKVLRNSFRAKIAHILRLYLPVNLKWGIYLLAKCQIAKTTSYTMYEMVVQIYWRMGWWPSAEKWNDIYLVQHLTPTNQIQHSKGESHCLPHDLATTMYACPTTVKLSAFTCCTLSL